MKNVSRNKFLLCFQPAVNLDSEGHGSRKSSTRGPSVKYISDHKDCSKSSSKKIFSQSKRERKSSNQDEFDRKLMKSFSVCHIQEIKSNPVLSSSKSSCCSLSESKASQNTNQERETKVVSSTKSSQYAITLLLMSLAVTIIWGKVCAILFTAIWFYFLPQQTNCRPPENVKEKMIIDKRESTDRYKKRIIMEGLLERTTTKRVH